MTGPAMYRRMSAKGTSSIWRRFSCVPKTDGGRGFGDGDATRAKRVGFAVALERFRAADAAGDFDDSVMLMGLGGWKGPLVTGNSENRDFRESEFREVVGKFANHCR